MRCSKCGADNREGARFCDKCGSKFSPRCVSCGAENRTDAKFCDSCGAAFGADATVAAPAAKMNDTPIRVTETSAAENLEGERKTITALFADIKGSMELIEDLDPEEARAIVDPALKLMMEAVQRYGGHVSQSTGDGVFALFGAPVAHEDHPQRALHAALRIQDEMQRYSAKLREAGHPPVEARVGVNTGEVVMRSLTSGEGGHTEYAPVGHSISLAARMQVLAPIGSIATTEGVRRLCEGYFLFKPLGPSRVKGVSDPINVYEVTGVGPLRSHFQLSTHRGLTRFVGRGTEMEAIVRAAELAKAGHGQLVCVVAEPGVGKSRLFYEFKAKYQSGWMVLDAFSLSHGKASAYLPVIELLHPYFDIKSEDEGRKRREKVTGRVIALDPALEDTRHYLFALLGIVEGEDPLAQMDANIRKRRTLDAIKRILLRESLNQPLIVMFEDLHWIDEQTQEFLSLLADSIANAKILLLVNYRPEYSHQWGSKTHYTQLRLDPLGKASADEMLAALLGDGADLAQLKRVIIERTEGNPFFMEETAQVLLDEGALVRNGALHLTKPLGELKIPPTVQGILAARIDRLSADAKDLLQSLSVIRRQFPISLVRAVVSKSDDKLDQMLTDLQLGEFIYEQPAAGDTEYIFKHALTQEVAYNSMLLERRKQMHARIGEAIETLYADSLDDHLTILAQHYSRAASPPKAVEYLSRSGERALKTFANDIAAAQLRDALSFVEKLADTKDRASTEAGLQLLLAQALSATEGGGSLAVGLAYKRALEKCESAGMEKRRFSILLGLAGHYDFAARLREARESAFQSLALAERLNDLDAKILANLQVANNLFVSGNFVQSRSYHETARETFDTLRQNNPSAPTNSASDPFYAWTLWFLGFPDKALFTCNETLSLFRELPYQQAHETFAAAQIFLLRGDIDSALTLSQKHIDLSVRHGFTYQIGRGTIQLGYVHAILGDGPRGLGEMRRGAQVIESTGAPVRSYQLAEIAEVCARMNLVDEGLQVVQKGLEAESLTHEQIGYPELLRIRGTLLRTREASNHSEAEQAFRDAIEAARTQVAKSYELRATTSLARLLRETDRPDEARAMLAEIYNWFTEGFDTADLKDAKTLIDELNN